MPRLKLVKPDEKPKERPRNPYSDVFEAAFVEHYGGDPYIHTKAGFVQLAALVKAYGGAIEMECWQRAVKNYFDTPRQNYTLAHLCCNFAGYKKCAADIYGKPVDAKRGKIDDSPQSRKKAQAFEEYRRSVECDGADPDEAWALYAKRCAEI